jgi:hypothetical protein
VRRPLLFQMNRCVMKLKQIAFGLLALCLSGAAGYAVTVTGTDSTGTNSITKVAYKQLSIENAITAFAGGGQTNAYQLSNAYNRVTVVATAADSVKLSPLCNTANVGLQVWVANADASDALNAFPPVGDAINLLSANTAISVPAVKSMVFTCVATNLWQSTVSN